MPHWTCNRCGTRLYSASQGQECPTCADDLAPERRDEPRFDRKGERGGAGPPQGPHVVPAEAAEQPPTFLRAAAEEAREQADERDHAAEEEAGRRAKGKLHGEASELRNLATQMEKGETLKGEAARAWWESLTPWQRTAISRHL